MPLSISLQPDCDGVNLGVYRYCGNEIFDIFNYSEYECGLEYIISFDDMIRLRDYLNEAIEEHKVI